MIDDVIEVAFAELVVRGVVSDALGWDEYLLESLDQTAGKPPVSVWVRPDGRFSRASDGNRPLTLGQVVRMCGLARKSAAADRPPTHGTSGTGASSPPSGAIGCHPSGQATTGTAVQYLQDRSGERSGSTQRTSSKSTSRARRVKPLLDPRATPRAAPTDQGRPGRWRRPSGTRKSLPL